MLGFFRDKDDVSPEENRLDPYAETKVGEPEELQVFPGDVRHFLFAPHASFVLCWRHGADCKG